MIYLKKHLPWLIIVAALVGYSGYRVYTRYLDYYVLHAHLAAPIATADGKDVLRHPQTGLPITRLMLLEDLLLKTYGPSQ